MRDFKKMEQDSPEGIHASPYPDNIMMWNAVIIGPPETPFEDGVFKLVLSFDEEYPTKPPKVKFVSKIFHPNGKFFLASFTNAAVYNDGNICLDILNTRWTPTYDVAAILTSIQSLLHDPNPESPANAQAANFYKNDRKEYEKLVRATVEASWRDD